MRMIYQLGLPLLELDALQRVIKEITNIVLCDPILENHTSEHIGQFVFIATMKH